MEKVFWLLWRHQYKSKEELNMFKLWGIKKLNKNSFEHLRKEPGRAPLTSDKNLYSDEDEEYLEGLPDSCDSGSDVDNLGEYLFVSLTIIIVTNLRMEGWLRLIMERCIKKDSCINETEGQSPGWFVLQILS